MILNVLVVIMAGLSIGTVAQTAPGEKAPQPLPGYVSTFSLSISGPYLDLNPIASPVKLVKKGKGFVLKIVWANTADKQITVELFTQQQEMPAPFDIRDSRGNLAFNDKCMEAVNKYPPFGAPGPNWWHRMIADVDRGKPYSDDFVVFGVPDRSCFDTDVPGTYTIQLRKLDPYTNTFVYSNKIEVTITE